MGKSYWLLVTSPEDFRTTERLGFIQQAFKRRYRKRVAIMQPGDRIAYYITGLRRFVATVTVTSNFFEERGAPSQREVGDDHPYRVRIKADVLLPPEAFLDARDLAPRLLYVKKWPPESWALAFQGMLHQLPKDDFQLIEDEMRRAIGGRPVETEAAEPSP